MLCIFQFARLFLPPDNPTGTVSEFSHKQLAKHLRIPEVVGPDTDLANSSDSGTAPYFEPMGEADIAGAIEKAFRSDEDTMLQWRKNVIDRASRFSRTAFVEKTEAILEML